MRLVPSPGKIIVCYRNQNQRAKCNWGKELSDQEAGIMKDVKVMKLTADRKHWHSIGCGLMCGRRRRGLSKFINV